MVLPEMGMVLFTGGSVPYFAAGIQYLASFGQERGFSNRG
jgi:hypothetical protein